MNDLIKDEQRKKIDLLLIRRAKERGPFEFMKEAGIAEAYMAGNSLNRTSPNDIDLFPVTKKFSAACGDGIFPISNTKNAMTYRYMGTVIQLCNYEKSSLSGLVNSFDFAHIQVGALIRAKGEIAETYYTDDWVSSHVMETTWFVGSDYPLSSLIRTIKYANRGTFSGKSYIPSMIHIVSEIVRRGFKDYEDFKDQLDAVDLGLVQGDVGFMKETLEELYNLLLRK